MNQKSESIAKIMPALTKAIGEIKSVHKDQTNPFFKSKYASLDAIIDGTKDVLAANKLAVVQIVNDFGVETFVIHESGEWISTGTILIPLETSQKNTPAQLIGINVTYAKRYQLASILNVSTGEDTDGEIPNGRDESPKGNPQSKAPAPVKAPAPAKAPAPVPINETPPKAPAPKPIEKQSISDERVTKACELISKGDFKTKESLLKTFNLTDEQMEMVINAEDLYHFNNPDQLPM